MSSDNTISTENGIEIYSHEIYAAIDNYLAENPGVDLLTVGQYQFRDLLFYIHDTVFYNGRLKDRYNNNKYRMDDVLAVYEIFRRICNKYNKLVVAADFSVMTGIATETFCSWGRSDSTEFNGRGSELRKKLFSDQETGLAEMMVSSGRNPVGYIAWLNHYHDWATTAAANGIETARRNPAEIAAAHGVAIETGTRSALPTPGFISSETVQ